MGYREISIKLPTDYTDDLLRHEIGKQLNVNDFSFRIDAKSLDARKKSNIYMLLRVAVLSEELQGGTPPPLPELRIPHRKRQNKRALVVGSGPAGFFSALILQKAGFETTIIERGSDVTRRTEAIRVFESTGVFDPRGNYAFGEGGAGTFSDGKLTSRTKNISKEKQFVIDCYIAAGAPAEIAYMAHPHLGSDNLRIIIRRLRDEFSNIGGRLLFETELQDLRIENGRVKEAMTRAGGIEADLFIIAPGLSAIETYRMLMRRNVGFTTKNFAIGCRVEHPQEIINRAQWGRESLPGVKAAEYRLTSRGDSRLHVYTFCMCPGGVVVPATAYPHTNIVNGMSLYQRNGRFANAACVAGVGMEVLTGKETSPEAALEWLEALENRFYDYADGFAAPYCSIQGFIDRETPAGAVESSYPLGVTAAPLWEMLPAAVSRSIREGLRDFCRKIRGFETGIILGLESKTSAPVQVMRDKEGQCAGVDNLYIVGEGSGYAGGIISSASDGIRTAMKIAERVC